MGFLKIKLDGKAEILRYLKRTCAFVYSRRFWPQSLELFGGFDVAGVKQHRRKATPSSPPLVAFINSQINHTLDSYVHISLRKACFIFVCSSGGLFLVSFASFHFPPAPNVLGTFVRRR